jgi:hypothetical protein
MHSAYGLELMAQAGREARECQLDQWAREEFERTNRFLNSAFWLLIDMMLGLIVAGEVTFVRAGIRFW